MNLVLEENEELPFAIKRIAVEQIDLALHHLRDPGEDLNKSVHATRQSLKRLRSLVAFVRGELGERAFKRETACYKNAAQLLACGRDAAAGVQTFDALIGRFSGDLMSEAFASQRCFLIERRDDRLKLMAQEGAIEKASEMLVLGRERIATWRVKHLGFKALRRGIRCSYRSGCRDLRRAVRHRTATNFHQWRHPVKQLWHQLQILTPIWPVMLNAHSAELGALSDRLNENHDLDMLRDAKLWLEFETQSREPEALGSLIDRRRRELETEALYLGERLYSERPRRFTDRIESYWDAWERGKRDDVAVSRATGNIAMTVGAQPL